MPNALPRHPAPRRAPSVWPTIAGALAIAGWLAIAGTPARAQCTVTGTDAYTCSGDLSDGGIVLGTTIPDSAQTIVVDNLSADISPDPDGTGSAAIDLQYGAGATAGSPISLTVTSADYAVTVPSTPFIGILLDSTSADGTAGTSAAGGAGRALTFRGAIDVTGTASGQNQVSGVALNATGGTGATPAEQDDTGNPGGDGGDGGAVTATGSGTYSGSTAQNGLYYGIAITAWAGDGGTGGQSKNKDGGAGGNGGTGGAIALGADGTWTINATGDLETGLTTGAVVAETRGGAGGAGGSGGDHHGFSGDGGDGGAIRFVDAAGDAWVISSTNVTGMLLVSQGAPSSATGHQAGSSGSGGDITKASGSTVEIATIGADAIAFQALSRGAQAVPTGSTNGSPGAGGAVTIEDDWTINTGGDQAHGIAAYSLGGSPASGTAGSAGAGGAVTVDITGSISTAGDEAFGIVAQSIGGHDGSGGTQSDPSIEFGLVEGASVGSSGTVTITSAAAITTSGQEAAGIGVQSVGGGGGAHGSQFNDFFTGTTQTVGGVGGEVLVTNSGPITTLGAAADGILAQSIGGAGGVGSISGAAKLGSDPSQLNGSGGGIVSVLNTGTILAGGQNSSVVVDTSDACGGGCSVGIFAQSVGGGGGKGHTAKSAFTAVGGTGGAGGGGADVSVLNAGSIATFRDHSAAIEAQSIGGGGGQGGGAIAAGAGFSHAVGGQGGNGGLGANVLVQHQFAAIQTYGDNSDGIHAQSIGGGGGRGGFAISGTIVGASVAVGGKGGSGGNASMAVVCLDQTGSSLSASCDPGLTPPGTTPSTIVTAGDNAKGVFAHSVGGGGGNGGYSVAATASIGFSGAVSVGGNGAGAGNASSAQVFGTVAAIRTGGDDSAGVAAISAGGGGGNGGFAIAGTVTIPAGDGGGLGFGLAVGGQAGGGGHGGAAEVHLGGDITTAGDRSAGLFAQSVGGGGGNGGMSAELGISASGTANVGIAIGGAGGSGGDAATATATYASGTITTAGASSHGILAQSIAGGGGHGGLAVAGGISGSQSTNLSLALGGAGGGGGTSAAVSVTNSGTIATAGGDAHAILAQSQGGGGGYGGMSVAGSIQASNSSSLSLSLAGAGDKGGNADTVTVTNSGALTVTGAQSKGIVAQSIGGAGGHGGLSITGTIETSSSSQTAAVSLGGAGGKGGSAKAVKVTNSGTIVTGVRVDDGALHQEYGIFAQSISGDGGYGGISAAAETNRKQKSVEVTIGGSGGGTSAAGTVSVANAAAITTHNDNSDAILAQSIGGNGGAGGAAIVAELSPSTSSSGNTYSLAIGGGGGSGANGSDVTVTHSAGAIQTVGANAGGIIAQSIGGGGGQGGSNTAYSSTYEAGQEEASTIGVNIGGLGGDGSTAGAVSVTVTGGSIATGTGVDATSQDSGDTADRGHALFALSQGGGGGNGGIGMDADVSTSGGGDLSVGGAGGSGASAGTVTVAVSNAALTTNADNSHAVLAQSIGGGGGNGGLGIGGSVGTTGKLGLAAAIGGSGGASSNGGTVDVTVASALTTHGAGARGLVAQSIGGGGGDGGVGVGGDVSASDAITKGATGKMFSLTLGGSGSAGGQGGEVKAKLTATGTIATTATATSVTTGAHAILAQSVGGGGGNGGYAIDGNVSADVGSANAVLALGGSAGNGGDGGRVWVTHEGAITTAGDYANGILAQSVGGGGGSGGFFVKGTVQSTSGLEASLGGSGGSGGDGGPINPTDDAADNEVYTTLTGAIATAGDNAHAVVLQSVGGGGGIGGLAVNGGFTDTGEASVAVGLGGSGGSGGDGAAVNLNQVSNASAGSLIATAGSNASGILAQSVGGGGGVSASTLNGKVGSQSSARQLALTLGGTGGSSGDGGALTLVNLSPLQTGTGGASGGTVYQSHGILAQSVGGGGGQAFLGGGLDYEATTIGVTLAAGADGRKGSGGAVSLTNSATIDTFGIDSHAILAQSVGGGGGVMGLGMDNTLSQSGASLTYAVNLGAFSSDTVSAAGDVAVTNTAALTTGGDGSYGILAQSIAGGGGYASSLYALAAGCDCSDQRVLIAAADSDANRLGAKNAENNNNVTAGAVRVANHADIATTGDSADAILAQAIGGGGGIVFDGGTSGTDDDALGVFSYSFAIGGNGVGGNGGNNGVGSQGGSVTVQHQAGTLSTGGIAASAIYAQSIGAGGGRALTRAYPHATSTVLVGGVDGANGDAGAVSVSVAAGAGVVTRADSQDQVVASFGVFAQSVGGGGGHGGIADFQGASAGAKLAASGTGLRNTDGKGGTVAVTIDGTVATAGHSSVGVFAQSVGGGGGLIGWPSGISDSALAFGSNGGDGGSSDVTVTVAGTITTSGDYAHAIVAQSAAGDNHKGANVDVSVASGATVAAGGTGTYGIWADSAGGNGSGTVTVTNDGTVSGGSKSVVDTATAAAPSSGTSSLGATSARSTSARSNPALSTSARSTSAGAPSLAVATADGAGLVITHAAKAIIANSGTIGTVDGTLGDAVRSAAGIVRLDNGGTIVGDLHLAGARRATVRNLPGGLLRTGTATDLGAAGRLLNAGRWEVLGTGTAGTTALTGSLALSNRSVLAVDLDPDARLADQIQVSGSASLAGRVEIDLLDIGSGAEGRQAVTLVSAAGGVTVADGGLALTDSLIAGYRTRTRGDDLVLSYDIDFAAPRFTGGLTDTEAHVADYLDALYRRGELSDVLTPLLELDSVGDYAAVLRRYSGSVYAENRAATLLASLDFARALDTCETTGRMIETEGGPVCAWLEGAGSYLEVGASSRSVGFIDRSFGLAGGLDGALTPQLTVGGAFQYLDHNLKSGSSAHSDGSSLHALARVRRSFGRASLGLYAGGGSGWFDVERALPFAVDTDARQTTPYVQAGASLSYRFGSDRAFIQPTATVGVAHYFAANIREPGSAGTELDVTAEAQTVGYIQPALKVGATMALTPELDLKAHGSVGLTGILQNDPQLKAAFVGATPAAGTFPSPNPIDDVLVDLDLGLTLSAKRGWSLDATGSSRLSDTTQSFGATLSLGYTF